MDQRDGSLGTADHVGESEGQPDSAEEPDVPSHAPLLTQVVSYVAASLVLAIALYVVLRPENYGLTPNSLDPLFYSGYAINFDDVLNAAGQRHYFVSRWTAYLPGYVSDQIAGPFLGRLLLRLVLASLVLSSLWVLGARQRWTWAQRVFIGGLVVSMPMFTRAFFTDYVEYMVVALGICLVALCLRENASVGSSALVGALAAAIVIANPIAITAVAVPLGVYILLASSGVRRRLAMSATVVVAGILLVSVGLIWFRWRYGLENVYRPSIEFARNYEGRDGFKSPRLDWLWYFTWLFATPLILVVAAGVGIRRVVRFERFEIAAFVLCGLQYAYQWIDQFVRDGNGLEVSYYWSFAYPTFAVALALLVGKITADTRSLTLYLLLAGWVVVLLIYVRPDLESVFLHLTGKALRD